MLNNNIYTLKNIGIEQKDFSIIIKRKIKGYNKHPQYQLMNNGGLSFELSNGDILKIPEKYIWDGSSSPRFLWGLFSSDGDFEVASLIHDYLYEFNLYDREFADNEMLKWSIKTNGTEGISVRNLDNYIRFYAVRIFGWYVWKK